VQPPVFVLMLRTQSDDRGYATRTAISSPGGVEAGVCWVHRSIVASRP
jgi:hypothetical protein